jgi:hypothetical protein
LNRLFIAALRFERTPHRFFGEVAFLREHEGIYRTEEKTDKGKMKITRAQLNEVILCALSRREALKKKSTKKKKRR